MNATPPLPKFRQSTWHFIAHSISIVVLVLGVLLSFAGPIGISRLPIIAGIVGARNALTVAGASVCIVGIVLLVVWKRARSVIASLTAALLVITLLSGAQVIGSGETNDDAAPVSENQLRILSWNINGDLASPATVADVARVTKANVVVLPEMTRASVGALRGLLPGYTVSPSVGTPEATTYVLTSADLRYRTSSEQPGPHPDKEAVLTSDQPGLPTIVAVHGSQPALRGNADWNDDLNWVAQQCSQLNTVVVGDFNATVDNFGNGKLGSCSDAASTHDGGSVGTWPTQLPTFLGMPLDHVLATEDRRILSFTVITSADESGARHRPILAVLPMG
ncbi:endonuclease/exonuclease/phosphatase family protein [Subtercola sp. PAMC28395]|uniref:endonuclease/exonuclease/phosphatase family protein n=1 Tax=Subtercola sp. PAMC28395 TaxID=2846775 RepID=UPI001C0CA42B|nr:endonuclease/exonuclease/phosphatase family protein [Subtercola sp. PAMC28395]QWT23893.1 endonuclease/exonuclease/phosphatase family protein [Subtercola sp. PAMC28395]